MSKQIIKTPVRYDEAQGYIFDRENKIVVDAALFRGLSNPITEHIALCINDHDRLTAELEVANKRVGELEAENARLRNVLYSTSRQPAQCDDPFCHWMPPHAPH